jgi:hypothetical protein
MLRGIGEPMQLELWSLSAIPGLRDFDLPGMAGSGAVRDDMRDAVHPWTLGETSPFKPILRTAVLI